MITTTMPESKGKELKSARKKARSEERKSQLKIKRQAEIDRIESLWSGWQADKSDAVRLAELIRYLNRYCKVFGKFRSQTAQQQKAIAVAYSLKDAWITANKAHCISHCKSAEFENSWIDYDRFNNDKFIYDCWLDLDDYRRTKIDTFYAYEFDIEGQIFRFHSQQCLFKADAALEPFKGTHGATKPLTPDERSIDFLSAIRMAAHVFGKPEKWAWSIKEAIHEPTELPDRKPSLIGVQATVIDSGHDWFGRVGEITGTCGNLVYFDGETCRGIALSRLELSNAEPD